MAYPRPKHVALRSIMAAALPQYNAQVAFVKDLRLDFTMIAFDAAAMLSWEAILTFADQQGKIDALIDKAIERFADNAELAATLAALKAGRTPVADASAVPSKTHWAARDLHAVSGAEDTFVDVEWLQRGWRAARAVCRVWRDGAPVATGFLVDGNRIVTNHHVLANAVQAASGQVEFDYQVGGSPQKFDLDPNNFATGGDDLAGDWTVVGVKGDPAATYEPLALRPVTVKLDEWVNIIQHPAKQPKRLSYSGNFVRWQGVIAGEKNEAAPPERSELVQYLTDTLPGSSGAPVFNKHWDVVAIHHGEFRDGDMVKYEQPTGSTRAFARNEGVLVAHILRALAAISSRSSS
ncbi:MAG: trypsin-like peptidase domain-containing protein [Myxococcales bacterium]|nr:trypsin-like peptidase domain-containing protein [Myxococcales bacterium]